MPVTTDTLATQIAALQQSPVASRLPEEVRDAFGAEQAALDAAGVPEAAARLGTAMPDGELLDPHGLPISLSAVRAGRPAVVVLYRGGWCPYCNTTLRAYQTQLVAELEQRDVILIAVSPQKPDGSLSTKETDELTFDVVSDPGSQIARALGVMFQPGEDALAAQEQLGLVLGDQNADGTSSLPMPTVAIVDGAGALRWLDIHPDYTTRTEPAAILEAVDEVLSR